MKIRNSTAKWLSGYNRWQIKVTNDNGERRTFYSSTPGRKGQTECNRKADDWLRSTTLNENVRCGDLLDQWLKDLEKRSQAVTMDGKPTTTSHYAQMCSVTKNWIRPRLKAIKIGKLRRIHLQECIDAAYDAGLAKKTLCNVRGAISLWLAYCRKRDITRLTTADLEIPKNAPASERRILQADELNTLFSDAETVFNNKPTHEWYIHAWRFAVALGLRPGELIAVERRHVQGDRLLVRGAINSLGAHTQGKNANSHRDIVLHPMAQKLIEDQLNMLRDAGVVSQYLFPAEDGGPSNQNVLGKRWRRYRQHHNLGDITLYELRHTFVSIAAGLSDLSIGELRTVVGHSKNMDTLGTYAHKLTEADRRIADKISDAYAQIITQK